jgi:hypothetical protein
MIPELYSFFRVREESPPLGIDSEILFAIA